MNMACEESSGDNLGLLPTPCALSPSPPSGERARGEGAGLYNASELRFFMLNNFYQVT
jgi:hypothetical protein